MTASRCLSERETAPVGAALVGNLLPPAQQAQVVGSSPSPSAALAGPKAVHARIDHAASSAGIALGQLALIRNAKLGASGAFGVLDTVP